MVTAVPALMDSTTSPSAGPAPVPPPATFSAPVANPGLAKRTLVDIEHVDFFYGATQALHDVNLQIEDKKVFQKAMDEALRLHPPAPALIRSPIAKAKLSSGREFQAGELVALDLVKVNRDPKAFGADAEVFNPDRSPAPMVRAYGLAFGAGAHFCLGQPMVTMSKGGLDRESVGSQYKLITALYQAGIRQDPQHPPVLVNSAQDRYDDYPVIFDRL